MATEQKEAPKKEGASAPLAQKKGGGGKEPLFEGIIIRVPQGKRGALSVFIPRASAEGEERKPSITCMGGRIFVGRNYLEVEPGEKKNGKGERVAKVTVMRLLEPEELENLPDGEVAGPKVKEVLEVPQGGEKMFSAHGFECRVGITRFEREVDPDADTNPHIMIPEGLLSGEEEVHDRMRLRTLNRGDLMELEGGRCLRYFGRIPGGNAFLDIIGRNGKCEKEFDGKEGESFEVELSGVEDTFILRLMRVADTGGGIGVFWFPKIEEKE